MKTNRLVLLVAIVIAVAAFFVFDLDQYLTLDFFKAQREGIEAYRDAHPGLVVVTFFLIYVAVTGLSLPGAALMTLVGGAIFGLLGACPVFGWRYRRRLPEKMGRWFQRALLPWIAVNLVIGVVLLAAITVVSVAASIGGLPLRRVQGRPVPWLRRNTLRPKLVRDPVERVMGMLFRLFARQVTIEEVPALVDDTRADRA